MSAEEARRVRRLLKAPRTVLVGGVVVALVGGFAISSALAGTETAGGVTIHERASVVSVRAGDDGDGDDGGAQFAIAGNASRVLYPSSTSTIDLSFTNPTKYRISLKARAVGIAISTPAGSGCGASANFHVVHTLTKPITIKPHAKAQSLSAMGVPTASWPVISMLTTNFNQDACAGLTITLHYSASGSSGDGGDDGD